MLLKERFAQSRPFETMDMALVRACIDDASLLAPHEEAIVRTALSIGRLHKVRSDGVDIRVGPGLAHFRHELERRLVPILLPPKGRIRRELLAPHLEDLKKRTLEIREALETRYGDRLSPAALDKEIRHKALVVVAGGGGGTGYVYAGALGLLDEYGLKPSLLVGTSIGAILSLFRARTERFEKAEILSIVRGLTFRRLFRAISTENRYGLPAALRLFLRSGIGAFFNVDDPDAAGGARLADLKIPTIITVSGIRKGRLPRPIEFYERLLGFSATALWNPLSLARVLPSTVAMLAEFFNNPELLVPMHLGADELTQEFDAIDAAGFSSALPGVIHYDVLRKDPRMHDLLEAVMTKRRVMRLVDGGLVDNLACRCAWKAVERGQLGTRNTFILGLNAFSMKASTPLWLPLERLAEINVSRNRPYAHLVKDFRRTLSPLSVVPSTNDFIDAMELGRKQLFPDMPFVTRMLAPLPRL